MSPTSKRHVLAINNDAAVLELFRDLLTEEGYAVSTQKYLTRDLEQVIELAPDGIILDYMWADEDEGWSFLQMLKMEPKTAGIPIILCTGAVKQVRALEFHLEEMDVQVLLKPFDIDELLNMLRTTLSDTTADPASD